MAKTNNGLVAVAVFLGITALTPAASARDQLRIVGSSTVYPFTTAVAEQFGKATGARTPVIEVDRHRRRDEDLLRGHRRRQGRRDERLAPHEEGEFDACQKNGVTEIIEVNIGFDGLTMAQSKTGAPMKLTLAQVFLALAEQVPAADGKLVANPHKLWSDIDRSLPNHKIEVLGPPPTSGTRVCSTSSSSRKRRADPGAKALKSADPKAFEKIWKSIRRDGAYVEAGENDNVIVQKLEINKDALGVFGYSFLEENAASCAGSPSTTPIRPSRTSPTGSTRAPGACTFISRSSISA